MKLNPKEFKRFKELTTKVKSGKATAQEEAELSELSAKKNERGSNDIKWWSNYPALLRDVTNFPFNWIPGTEVPITGFSGATDSLKLGVMAKAMLRPGIGRSLSDADAFNSQIRQLWLDMHRKYRGIGTYQKSDVGIAILAIQSVFETLAKFERIYGVINTYHIGNRVVPAGLKEMLNISNDLEENLADFRYTLNLYITKLKQLCLPKGMGVIESDIVAMANLFKDSDNTRAFIFCYDADVYGVYDPTLLATGGCVKYHTYVMSGVTPNNRYAFTLNDVRTTLETQVAALLNDDDISKICSDILAAYGPENAMQLVEVPENYRVEPVHDYERQLQFHNLTVNGKVAGIYEDGIIDNTTANSLQSNGYPIVIYQNNDAVICRLGVTDDSSNYVNNGGYNYPQCDVSARVGCCKEGEVLFDTWVEKPGDLEVMCGTRYTSLAAAPVTVSTDHIRQEIISFGTKVVTDISTFCADSAGVYSQFVMSGSVVGAYWFNTFTRGYLAFMQMDWHPIFYVPLADLEIFGDIDNFTKIDIANLRRLHEVALLSGYKIPAVASYDK